MGRPEFDPFWLAEDDKPVGPIEFGASSSSADDGIGTGSAALSDDSEKRRLEQVDYKKYKGHRSLHVQGQLAQVKRTVR